MERAASRAIDFALSCSARDTPPEAELLASVVSEAAATLAGECEAGRPRSESGLSGGLVRIPDSYVIVVPDIHARPRLLLDLLRSRLRDGASVAESLASGLISIVCLGDILHSEGQAAALRWTRATDRLIRNRGVEGLMGPEMETEMALSLSTLLEVCFFQKVFPGRFRCLKGNHDNMGNRSTDGDSPFGKYSHEGLMGAEWFTARYGRRLLGLVREYELLLPLVASGRGFCASHAEPGFAVGMRDLLQYRSRPALVRALTWTRDGEAEAGSVAASLDALAGAAPAGNRRFWIAGHTALVNAWSLREDDGFLQIHCPDRNQVLTIDSGQGSKGLELELFTVDPLRGLLGGVPISPRY